jgi:hypothetical protein
VKPSLIKGYVLNVSNSQPIPEVAIQVQSVEGSLYTYKTYMTGGDGCFTIPDLNKGLYTLSPEKFGWVATPTTQVYTVHVVQGETVQAPMIWMEKKANTTKGTLRGYPIDGTTGSPLQNFTISMKDPAKYKIFETSQDFKEAGWAGLEGGAREFTITCENYKPFAATGTIGITPFELGIIRMNPEMVSIMGTIRNLPGYIIGDSTSANFSMQVWAESANKVIASGSVSGSGGQAQYVIPNIPVSIGNVSVKCKIRGYDLTVINPSLNIPKQRPTGIIGGVDVDFANIEPIKRDVRVVVRGSKPAPGEVSTVDNGDIIRVYIRQGGKDIVPYVDVVGNNFMAEAYFTGVVTGYKLDFLAVNLNRGYNSKSTSETILEDGGTTFTLDLPIS